MCRTLKVIAAAVAGVPLMSPLLLARVSPAGNEPLAMLHE